VERSDTHHLVFIRHAHGLHNSQYRHSVLIRSAAEEKLREADQRC
jgi:hypothetical protein